MADKGNRLAGMEINAELLDDVGGGEDPDVSPGVNPVFDAPDAVPIPAIKLDTLVPVFKLPEANRLTTQSPAVRDIEVKSP